MILGAFVLAAVLWSSFPSSTLASGPMCTLACCAGRAPHAAGSCMNGSCHAFLNRSQSLIRHKTVPHVSEKLCGLPRLAARLSPSTKTVASGFSQTSSSTKRASVASSALSKPCAPDCGAGTVSSNSQRRPRETSALPSANRNRPRFGSGLVAEGSANPYMRELRHRLANPRAPPTLVT
jgi:hypothetical protein